MKLTKSEMVREAWAKLGADAKFAAVRKYILETHEETIAEPTFYAEKKKMVEGAATTKAAVPPPEAASPAPQTDAVPIKDLKNLIAAVKGLEGVFGNKESLKKFIDAV